ncbi:MAG TPA: hypothetical protein VG734_21750 [Lacunisphaera sp.]|nr:hypothetical protein [Lacunisphaera sp.]
MNDRIAYTEPFQNHVGGRLLARFRPDAAGEPQFVMDDGLRHYLIDLLLDSPRAKEIKRVEYLMNDPTFGDDATAVSKDSDNMFPGEISSYGDVEVIVTIFMKGADAKYEQRAWLSNLLKNGHPGTGNAAIRDAIHRIEAR